MKIAAQHLLHHLEYARMRNLPSAACNPPAGIAEALAKAGGSVSVDDFYGVIRKIDAAMDDELWGIRNGNAMHMKLLGVIYRISLEVTTIGEALFYLENFLNATFPIIHTAIEESRRLATIRLSIANDHTGLNRQILENILAVISRELAIMSQGQLVHSISSPFFQSSYPDRWKAGRTFAIRFAPSALKASVSRYSRMQLDILVPEYFRMIEQLHSDRSFASRVRITALHMAAPQLPDLRMIADSLNLSPRTFQRRLESEQVTFRSITDSLKQDLSKVLLRHDGYSVTDISHVLGYAEPAAFIHSFKKWYGASPEKYRQQLVHAS